MAIIFWKDSMDFAKIIQNKEPIDQLPEKRNVEKNKGVFLRNQLNR